MIEQRRAEADALAQQILAAASPHEEMLHRDLFLAAALAADDVGLGQTTTAHLLERLTPLIASPIPTVQKQSIQGIAHLARLGSLAASAALLTALADPNLLHPALQNCLPVLRAPQGREVRAAIVGKLDDDSWDVRIAAVGALGSLVGSEPEVRAAIVGKLDDEFSSVRRAAVGALGSLVGSEPEVRAAIVGKLDDDSWPVRIAALDALLPLLPSDGEMAESLLPWLGMASQGRWNFSADRTSEDVLDDLVGLLAEGVAQSASLCQRIIHLLDARSAPARHRAARVLIAQPGGPPAELLPRLRGLLEDNRSEYRWPERLQVAELFLNHQDYALSQQAMATALDALDYGHGPWYCYWSYEPLYPPTIRRQAAAILGRLDPLHPHPAAFARLAQVLTEDSDEDVRDAAYGALLRLAAAPPAAAA